MKQLEDAVNILETQFEKIETAKAEVSELLTDKIDEKTKKSVVLTLVQCKKQQMICAKTNMYMQLLDMSIYLNSLASDGPP